MSKSIQSSMFEVLRPPAVLKVRGTIELAPGTLENLAYAAQVSKGCPKLRQLPAHEGSCVIVGGAPSVEANIESIREAAQGPFNITCSINCAHKWLVEHNIIPNIHVVFEEDIDPTVVFNKPHPDVVYYICSHCPKSVFDFFKDNKTVLWHHWASDTAYDQVIADLFPGEFMIGGGYTTLFRTINIALVLGYREFDLFGLDSSFEDDKKQHFAGYPTRPSPEGLTDIWLGDNKFRTLGALALQASMLREFCQSNSDRIKVRAHCGGLLKEMLQDLTQGD